MSSKKLLSITHFHPIPPIIRNSLQLVQNTCTQSNAPVQPLCPSHLATNLMKSFLQKGLIGEARALFDEMPDKDVVTWTAMISGYTHCNYHTHAWSLFYEMLKTEIDPNAYTMSNVLKACKGMNRLAFGALVHGMAIKHGIQGSIYVDNALMDMYATCGASMDKACMVFLHLKERNAVSWTTMIAGYTHRGDGHGGLQIFRQMLREEAELNPYSFSIAVRACTSIGSLAFGQQIHTAVTKCGLESNLPVTNTILDMYCRCGCLSEANQYFHEMIHKDLITWNTLIAGYERSDPSESLYIFSLMDSEGFSPNCFTFTSVLAACANLAILNCGQQVHGGIICRGLNRNLELSNALIDMYAKCGNINDSHKVFSELSERNLVTWTSIMIAYGAHGYGKEAVVMFDEMVRSGIRPDRIVFMAVLSACSHAGLVDEGLRYFKTMMGDYSITPDQEIYGCVVDLLGRAGRVEEAYQLIQSMPFKPDESVWGALLGACKEHRHPNLGKLAAERALDLRPNMVGAYLMLSNIYASEGKWGEFAKMRKMMRGMGSKKEVGRSWIQVRDHVYSFVVGDRTGHQVKFVNGVLELLIWHMEETGYIPDIDCFEYDLEDVT
ncbi:PPR domain-containing protein/PPR_2 domain-containing protein [Cephalotus follicularis]|uniref:PPR domain-containing protein/PPR_2 domain-containing protein n=1 Tax=Cephalotus follicularis TaxID=3775 RepID=A0A1Q3CLD8_CEPFO|nr:PPR domain-containing protein/PPR_2 domain-containing protein [Cephalotus follicularis]